MKVIQYHLCTSVNHGTEETPYWVKVLDFVTMPLNEVNEAIAKREAHNGEYTIVDEEVVP